MAHSGARVDLEVTAGRHQGAKRSAVDDLDGEQRLAKRFDLMHLEGNGGKLHISVAPSSSSNQQNSDSKNPTRSTSDSEWMQVEDTKDRIFIHDLDEELAEPESDDERPIFLPDIEKHLIKVPRAVLITDDDKKKLEGMQMVLYSVPSSLTLPEEQDSVRRAILEARQRARDNQGLTIPDWPQEPSHTKRSKLDPLHNMSVNDMDQMEIG